MSWRLRKKMEKAPRGGELVMEKLEEFETRMREANAEPRGERLNHELAWPVHRLHYEKNRYIHDMHYVDGKISKVLFNYLVKEKIADGPLIAKWRKPGYETLCSLAVITKSNTNFGTVGICRTPLKQRVGQVMPNVTTGCVCCATGCDGPIWWNDPIPDIVKARIIEADPGKAELLEQQNHFIAGDTIQEITQDHSFDMNLNIQTLGDSSSIHEQAALKATDASVLDEDKQNHRLPTEDSDNDNALESIKEPHIKRPAESNVLSGNRLKKARVSGDVDR